MRKKFFFGVFAVSVVIFLFFVFFVGVGRAQVMKLQQPVGAVVVPTAQVLAHVAGENDDPHSVGIVAKAGDVVEGVNKVVAVVHRVTVHKGVKLPMVNHINNHVAIVDHRNVDYVHV